MPTEGMNAKKKLIPVIALILLGILLSAFFGLGVARSMIRVAATGIEQGSSDAEAIRGWMTVPYLARVYELSSADIYAELGVPATGADSKSLQSLNKEFYPGRHGFMVERARIVVRKLLDRRGSPEKAAR